MTNCVVIDTNVILVANQAHQDVSPECVMACVERLENIMKGHTVVIDDAYRIINEYQNKTRPSRGKGPGDAFIKWLLRNSNNARHCEQVPLTESDENEFAEFPTHPELKNFDPPDRKFAAVAYAHAKKPPILQAADCKWVEWTNALGKAGIFVDFICKDDICRFYVKKFPGKPAPKLK